MATRSSTGGHRVVYGWPQGRPRMAQPVPAVSPRELVGATALTAHEHCWRPGKLHLRFRGPLVVQRQVPMYGTVRETLEVAQLPFIDKVVDTLVGAESDLERLFRQTCVSHVRRGSLRGSSTGCCCVCPTHSRYGVRCTSPFQLSRLRQVPAEARGDSSVAVVGKVVHMPVVVSSVSTVQKPSRIQWRFNRCRSWTKLLTWPLLCNDRWP